GRLADLAIPNVGRALQHLVADAVQVALFAHNDQFGLHAPEVDEVLYRLVQTAQFVHGQVGEVRLVQRGQNLGGDVDRLPRLLALFLKGGERLAALDGAA